MQSSGTVSAAARWREHVEEQARSGLTVGAYCAARGLAAPTFYEWRRRIAAGGGPARAAFVPVEVTSSSARRFERPCGSSGVEVILAGGARLRLERGFDATALRSAVAALEGRPC